HDRRRLRRDGGAVPGAAAGHDAFAASLRDGPAVPPAGAAQGADPLHRASAARPRVVDHARRDCGLLLCAAAGHDPGRRPVAMAHPDFAKAAQHITTERIRDALVDMVDIPSATGNEAAMARYLVERMRRAGL